MKIIEIRKTSIGEVAYVFEEQEGKIYKLLVEDLTGYTEDEEAPLTRLPQRKIKLKPVQMPTREESAEITVDDIPDDLPAPKAPVNKVSAKMPKQGQIPPNLISIFRKPGSPGAAVESREA